MYHIVYCSVFVCVVAVIDVAELEEQQVSEATVESWCVEEQAMEADISLLQQVEDLERKVTSASLQVKVQALKCSAFDQHLIFTVIL